MSYKLVVTTKFVTFARKEIILWNIYTFFGW